MCVPSIVYVCLRISGTPESRAHAHGARAHARAFRSSGAALRNRQIFPCARRLADMREDMGEHRHRAWKINYDVTEASWPWARG